MKLLAMPGELFAKHEGGGRGIIANPFVASVSSKVFLPLCCFLAEGAFERPLIVFQGRRVVCVDPLHSVLPSPGFFFFRNCGRGRRSGEIWLGGVTMHRKGVGGSLTLFLPSSPSTSLSLPLSHPPSLLCSSVSTL